MTLKKKVKELEGRINELENELNSFISAFTALKAESESKTTYEEVIDQWLNGKKTT